MEHSHVNYPDKYEIVNDCRVLKALKNRNYIKAYSKTHKYINEYNFMLTAFKYNNNDYVIKYFDGCFMPFVCKINNINLNNKGGQDNAK
jgi:hypothetical protein